jgi:hypothetical protein
MSKPHFLQGDPALVTALVGLSPPDPTLHDTTLDVEPVSGARGLACLLCFALPSVPGAVAPKAHVILPLPSATELLPESLLVLTFRGLLCHNVPFS